MNRCDQFLLQHAAERSAAWNFGGNFEHAIRPYSRRSDDPAFGESRPTWNAMRSIFVYITPKI